MSSDVGVADACGWKLLLTNVYAAEVCGIIEADNSGMGQYVGTHIAKALFYNRGRAILANFFLSNTTDKDSAGSMSVGFRIFGEHKTGLFVANFDPPGRCADEFAWNRDHVIDSIPKALAFSCQIGGTHSSIIVSAASA